MPAATATDKTFKGGKIKTEKDPFGICQMGLLILYTSNSIFRVFYYEPVSPILAKQVARG